MGAGLGLLLFTCLGGWIAISIPTVSPHLATAVYVSFWPGLLLVCASWVMSLVTLVIGLRTTAATRFERNHLIAVELSREVAASVPPEQMRERLRSVRLELALNARAPDKLPIAMGLIATLAASARFIMQSRTGISEEALKGHDGTSATSITLLAEAGAGLAPELAGIVLGTALGGFVARALIHDAQDRLLRTESLLERAAGLSGDKPDNEVVSKASGAKG